MNTNTITTHNRVSVIRGGADYFRNINTIADSAVYTLHLQTYIFDADETGQRVADALIRAARRNVVVYLMVDGYASQRLPKTFTNMLKEEGVHFAYFNPVFKGNFFYMGRRLHHKIIVADGARGMVAGINVSNRYNDIGDTRAWLDWAVNIDGEAATILQEVCIKTWNQSVFRKKYVRPIAYKAAELPENICKVAICRNDWVYRKTEITGNYKRLFGEAKLSVIIMTSYFWPPNRLRKLMAYTAAKGVNIKLILTEKADVPLSKYTERYMYNWLLRNKIEIYEYQSNVLHGKIAVCDDEWVTAGSYNMNNISAFASLELNAVISDKAVAEDVTIKLNQIMKEDCRKIDPQKYLTGTYAVMKLLYYLSYRITHLLFLLFTFNTKQKRRHS